MPEGRLMVCRGAPDTGAWPSSWKCQELLWLRTASIMQCYQGMTRTWVHIISKQTISIFAVDIHVDNLSNCETFLFLSVRPLFLKGLLSSNCLTQLFRPNCTKPPASQFMTVSGSSMTTLHVLDLNLNLSDTPLYCLLFLDFTIVLFLFLLLLNWELQTENAAVFDCYNEKTTFVMYHQRWWSVKKFYDRCSETINAND